MPPPPFVLPGRQRQVRSSWPAWRAGWCVRMAWLRVAARRRFRLFLSRSGPSASAQSCSRRQLQRTEGRLRWIEAVRHVVGAIQPRIYRLNSEQALAELHQADVRVLRRRDISFAGVWANNQTRNTRSVPELVPIKLRKRVNRTLRPLAVPLFDLRWSYMIVPSAPVIPRYEYDRASPQTPIHNGLDLLPGPFRARRDVLCRMFAVRQLALRIHPRNRREPAGGRMVSQ